MDTMSLEQNPLLSDVVLARPEDLTTTRCPTVALHLLVKNGESCVARLLDNVGPYIHEVVAIINDTTDRTVEVLQRKCKQYDLAFSFHTVTSESHPGFYILDIPETYQKGRPLAGEVYEGPFTNRPLLAKWAEARNLGWNRCTSEWRLFLDADDIVEDPESIPGLCLALEERGIELATSRYQYATSRSGQSHSDAFRERLARNIPAIQWHGAIHEVLKGQATTAHIEGNLRVIDRGDSLGTGIRLPGRNFKILYHECREKNWNVSPRTLIYLAQECRRSMPGLASAALDRYLATSDWREERAWACVMQGEICEGKPDYEGSAAWYRRALTEHPGCKSAFRLCHSLFQLGQWQGAIDAYQVGVANKAILQALDNGAVFEGASKILVAAAHRKLGRVGEALKFCNDALEAFPDNQALVQLQGDLIRDMRRGLQ